MLLQGYEGEGGLHKLLHGRGWVSSLSSGSLVTGIDFQLFRLSLSLTEEGERHTDEIIEYCHRFLALMRSEPPQKRIQVRLRVVLSGSRVGEVVVVVFVRCCMWCCCSCCFVCCCLS